MKSIIKLSIILVIFIFTSCLKRNLVSLKTYEGADIEGVAEVSYRYYSDEEIPASKQKKVKVIALNYSLNLDKEKAVCEINASEPSNIPSELIDEISDKRIVLILNISEAAVIRPIEDAPRLGVPADWSKPHRYEVVAANNQSRIWTIRLNYKK